MTCTHDPSEIVRRTIGGSYCRACRRVPQSTHIANRLSIARQEARALRAYLRATGRMPRCVATRLDL